MTERGLANLHVVFFESRLAKTMGDLIALQGGTPVSAPALKEVPLEDNPDAFLFAEKLFRGEIDVLILLTGVGTRYLVKVLETRYAREAILKALKAVTIIPRGPKPIRALKEMNVPFAVEVPEPNTWKEILNTLDQNGEKIPIRERLVAVQEYGMRNQALLDGLKKRGARILMVAVYRWALPDDTRPLKEAVRRIVAGEAEVAVFTTAVQAEHLFQVADSMGLREELKRASRKIVIASVGPDSSEAIRSLGLQVDIEPASPKMGPLVMATAEKATQILNAKRIVG